MPESTAGGDLSPLIAQRYGGSVPTAAPAVSAAGGAVMRTLLDHRSVRRFSRRDIDDDVLSAIVAAAQSAPSSSNRQCWSAVAVRDPARIDRLVAEARVSSWVRQAPLVVVFLADLARAATLAAAKGVVAEGADYLEATLAAFVDAGVAAQNALVAAESLGLGACIFGSIRNDPEAVATILHLPLRTTAVVGLALGFPDLDAAFEVKPRLPQSAVLSHETYSDFDLDSAASYDDALARFYVSRSRHPQASWRDECVAFVSSARGLDGRHRMREALALRGFPSN